jgi:signal-transduction protein with cAMP-binding, CBS, and nucleotidyltransferase domain
MREKNVSSLVVDKRDESDEYGILAVHDVAEQVIGKDRSPERVSVYEIMSKPVLSVDIAMNVKYAVRLLTRFRLTRALVLQDGKVAGFVTLRDLVLRSMAKPS